MTGAGTQRVGSGSGVGPGSRATAVALAASVGLHLGVAAAALWWPFGPTLSAPAAPTVEVAFWPAAEDSGPAAAVETPAESVARAPAPPAESGALPVADTMPAEPAPIEPQAVEAATPDEPTPTLAEPAIALFKPPPARPKRREAETPRPMPVAARAPAPPRPAPADPATVPAVLSPPDSTGSVTASPRGPAIESIPTATPSAAPAPAELAAAPPVVTQARFRSPPMPPSYPRRAIDLGQEGEVIIRALVGPDGESREVRIIRSSGATLLDDAALRAVRRWAFEAARVNGRPIEAWVEVPVRFQLRNIL